MKHAALALTLLACTSTAPPPPTTPQQPQPQPAPEQPVAVAVEPPVCANLEACRDLFVEAGTIPPLRQLERTVTGELGVKVAALIALVERQDPDLGTSVEAVVDATGDKALRELPADGLTQPVHDEFAKAKTARARLVRMTAIAAIVPIGPSVLDAAVGAYAGQRAKAIDAVDELCNTGAPVDACNDPAYTALTGHAPLIGLGGGLGPGGGRPATGLGAKGWTTTDGTPTATGDLDKAIIRRYIKRNIQKIRFCYEKELAKRPKLEGTVTVQFTISPKGSVSKAVGSGLSPEVASCVAKVIKAIEFPKPRSGSVQVSYPFNFHAVD